jgi:hypothetical protein
MAQHTTATLTDHGLIDCFAAGAADTAGKPYCCEVSGVLFLNKIVYLLSDRTYPGPSSVFTIPFSLPLANHGNEVKVLKSPMLANAIKWEDVSASPDGRWIFAITGFDRVKKNSHEWDNFNVLAYWPSDQPDSVKYMMPADSGACKSSIRLRENISRILANAEFPEGMPYFKTEALCITPRNTLLIGIREQGLDYEHFSYTFKILELTYKIDGNTLKLSDTIKLIYHNDSLLTPRSKRPMGLSSMAYCNDLGRFYFLTTFEDNTPGHEQIGSYLWMLNEEDLYAGKPLVPVRDPAGNPIHLSHKAEGMTLVNNSTLLILCDDDRYLSPLEGQSQIIRQLNQSVYYVFSLER